MVKLTAKARSTRKVLLRIYCQPSTVNRPLLTVNDLSREALLIIVNPILNNLYRGFFICDVFDNDGFVFELFVFLEEMTKFFEEVFRKFFNVVDVPNTWVVGCYGNDLIVCITA